MKKKNAIIAYAKATGRTQYEAEFVVERALAECEELFISWDDEYAIKQGYTKETFLKDMTSAGLSVCLG